jgi:hypothetical protein
LSIAPPEAEATAGNHQVFAAKKYELTNVISQMMKRSARPMKKPPPPFSIFLLTATRFERGEVYHIDS